MDKVAYRVLGDGTAPNSNTTVPNQKSLEVTPTRSSIIYDCGPVRLNVSFLSPIEVIITYLLVLTSNQRFYKPNDLDFTETVFANRYKQL